MIREGRNEEALAQLEPYAEDFRTFNARGVALMRTGRFEEALPWLQKALQNDIFDAQKNIDLIQAQLNYEEIKRKERQKYIESFR